MKAHIRLLIILLCFYFPIHAQNENKTDLVIFSFDRPLQLYALLESVEEYVTGLASIQVIYRTSNVHYEKAYNEVKNKFHTVKYIAQGSNPIQDFKPLTLRAFSESAGEYIIFAVDDDIIKDYVDFNKCIELMEHYRAYGFYLRLGMHLTDCYPTKSSQSLPKAVQLEPEIYAWHFYDGQFDWSYPNNVDLTLYRKKDVKQHLESLYYWSPNKFEAMWAGQTHNIMHQIGLCYKTSKIVNIPLNIVQKDFNNRTMNFMMPVQLLEQFDCGKKIDIRPLYNIKNKAAHMDYEPTFIERN